MNLSVTGGRRKPHRDAPEPSLTLLAWYDLHGRRLPWRAGPGERADPYRVWLSEIMLQQTRANVVVSYFDDFIRRWPTLRDLAGAPLPDVLRAWAGLGYYARARNLHACARLVLERHGGAFPDEETELRALPGIGAYTAAAIAAIAFGRDTTPIDGNIERVVARLFRVGTPMPAARSTLRGLLDTMRPPDRAGDFAQALMDLGATICTPVSPLCGVCPLNANCDARDDPEGFPRRLPRRPGKLRHGAVFVIVRGGRDALLRSRPATGLLGGMTELPGTPWSEGFDFTDALLHAPKLAGRHPRRRTRSERSREAAASALAEKGRGSWIRVPGQVTHAFTHFRLELAVYSLAVPAATPAPAGTRFVPLGRIHEEALPSLMRKALAHALGPAFGNPPPQSEVRGRPIRPALGHVARRSR